MTQALHDPAREPWEIVEEFPDGSARRNDGTVLRSRHENPWYVLMTLHGEQDGEGIDWDLAEQNRRAWNLWSSQHLNAEERADLAKKLDLPLEELGEDAKVETEAGWEFDRRPFRARLGTGATLPDPQEPIDLSATYFPASSRVLAGKYMFSSYANFQSAAFSGHADFESAAFSETAGFRSATFRGHADFRSATFSGTADFQSATFSGHAGFQSATFSGPAGFRSATFSGPAGFRSATFSGHAYFGSAAFRGSANFRSATFSGNANFGSASFSGDADFESATVSGDAYFQSATFCGDAYFHSASFSGIANFRSTAFGSITEFRKAVFTAQAPAFHACVLYQDTRFTTKNDHWPAPTNGTAGDDKSAYVRLRQLMNELHKPDDEHFFFRQEMRCEALLKKGWDKWIVQGFGWISDYGYGVKWPAACLFWLWLIGVAAFWGYFSGAGQPKPPDGPVEDALFVSIALSFSNVLPLFGISAFIEVGSALTKLPSVLKALSMIQSVFGFAFLFFLGLGLRNRFRLK